MSMKETIFSMMHEALNEAVEVRHDRYIRSHGKKARDSGGGSGSWMFTHKNMGDVNVNDKAEVHTAQGSFSDAKKSAQQWGKQHGHSSVYVMEEVDLSEAIQTMPDARLKFHALKDVPHGSYTKKQISAEHDRRKKTMGAEYASVKPSLNEEVELDEDTMPSNVASRLADSHFTAAFHHKKNGNMKGYASHLKVANRIEDAVIRAGSHMPIRSTQIEKASDKAFSDHPHRVVKNEEVELDEVSTEKLRDYAAAALQDKNKAKTDKRWKYASKAMNTVADRDVKAAHALKYNKMEEVQLDEISDEMKKKYIRSVADKGGILRKPRPASLAGIDKKKEDALVKALKGGSMQQYSDLHKKSEKRAEIGTKAIHSLKKEEVELDEAGRHLDYVPRKSSNTEVDVKGTKVPIKKHSWGDWEVPYGPHKDIGQHKSKESLVNALHTRIKEEVELDEAKTDIYHKHMLKALGKTRLPKNHPYTSSVANNGDFVVHSSGNVVARIPKGEHNLK